MEYDGIEFFNENKDIENDQFNRYLLHKYIKKLYMDNGANENEAEQATEELIIKFKDNLFGVNGLASMIGELSIPFFCSYFLQDTFVPKPDNVARELAPVHYMIWDTLENMINKDLYDKLELIMPRGTAKSTVVNFALSVYLHCYRKSIYTLVCGKTDQDSTEFIVQTRQAFEENPYIIKAFGKLIDSKNYTVNKNELELANRTKIQAISSTTSMRGKKYNGNRPSCIIADDYQSKADCVTEEARQKKYDTWTQDSEFAGDKAVYRHGKKIRSGTKFIVLGTIVHTSCFMSRLLKNKEYKHILRRACDFDVDEYFHSGLWEDFRKLYFNNKLQDSVSEAKEFYYQHEKEMQYKTIWQDKYSCLEEAISYYNNPTAWKQEMMNDASKIGTKWFASIKTLPYKSNECKDDIISHNVVKMMLCVDPASTDTKRSDSFAFLVGSVSDNGFKYIHKGELIKFDARTQFDEYLGHIIELLKIYKQITHVFIEKNTFNGSDANQLEKLIEQDAELSGRDIAIINESQRKNKDDKIASCVSAVNNGAIIFNEDDTDFIDEVKSFCGQNFSLHDDAPDCVSEFYNRIDNIEIIQPLRFLHLPKGLKF
ncbi:hypothetical protein [Clostridium scatologenes]|uniref:Terminase n=1 Tax=Clostridium scatologenes TaxID=1548 RepID=A0A0E3M8V0_CLOSL|nr:hypothetical protein [Clostridium scatologenes]AKA71963.1 hypothetical protein CSCA_4838 [Clostridium scatologenes]